MSRWVLLQSWRGGAWKPAGRERLCVRHRLDTEDAIRSNNAEAERHYYPPGYFKMRAVLGPEAQGCEMCEEATR